MCGRGRRVQTLPPPHTTTTPTPRRDGYLTLKLFKRHLARAKIQLDEKDMSNLIAQYGDDSGRYINYVAVMRQAFAARATHRVPTATRLESARLLHSQRSDRSGDMEWTHPSA